MTDMKITVEHRSGKGAHSRHVIRRGGFLVGLISRFSHINGWEICSAWYGHKLASGLQSLDAARERAQSLTYPTEQQVYDALLAECVDRRRMCAQQAEGPTLAALIVRMLAGDLTARAEADKVLASIEAFTADRKRYHWRDDPSPWARYERVGRSLDLAYPREPGT